MRLGLGYNQLQKDAISIHAPAKGATSDKLTVMTALAISIHAPAKGATSFTGVAFKVVKISIHAPAKGAT